MADRSALSGTYLTLLEGAESEAKRLDHAEARIEHLAILFARSYQEALDGAFGAGAAERIAATPNVLVNDGGPPLIDLLAEAASRQDNQAAIAAALAAHLRLAAADDPAGTDGETTDAGQSAPAPTTEPTTGAMGDAATDEEPRRFHRTARFVEIIEPDASVAGRDAFVDDLISHIGRAEPRAVLVSGPEGCGRTTVLAALANRLQDPAYEGPLRGSNVVRVRPERMLTGDAGLAIRQIVEDATNADEDFVVAVDDLELVLGFGAQGRMDASALLSLRAVIEEASQPLVLLVDQAFIGRLAGYDDEFMGEVATLDLGSPVRGVLEAIGNEAADRLATHHRVTIPDVVVRMALAPQGRSDLVAHPALLIDRLDGACARAAIRSDRTVCEDDLGLSSDPSVAPPDPDSLIAQLRARVAGQDTAVQQLAMRLALTRARLDLRPDRPDGVFLFVGPTGVGKTELARATAAALHGDERGLIRLDMSEYAQEWSISQLIGPPPGYVGSTDPDSWLTTKVRRQPQSVILLDEIEKAHHRVWNTFLQVFDVGRLTDSQGRESDFSQTVIILTSNLGAEAYTTPGVGFRTTTDPGADERRLLDVVKQTMAPELVNRLDGIVPFRPLSPDTIREIATTELVATCGRLGERGYRLEYGTDVIDLISANGYSPEYGARHLQRNIERLFLQPLASAPGRDLRAVVNDDTIRWEPLDAQPSHP